MLEFEVLDLERNEVSEQVLLFSTVWIDSKFCIIRVYKSECNGAGLCGSRLEFK